MNTKRPRIKVPLEGIDIVADLASLTILILIVVFTLIDYPDLPETIATHFNGAGEPDGYGHKSTLWLLPAVGFTFFIGFYFLNKYPHIHNYMVNITEENALKNYRISTRILRFVNFFTCILFAYIQYHMISSANNTSLSLGNWFIPLMIGISIILPAGMLIYQYKINKK
jgi:uncharacterized membrane protein